MDKAPGPHASARMRIDANVDKHPAMLNLPEAVGIIPSGYPSTSKTCGNYSIWVSINI